MSYKENKRFDKQLHKRTMEKYIFTQEEYDNAKKEQEQKDVKEILVDLKEHPILLKTYIEKWEKRVI